VELPEGL